MSRFARVTCLLAFFVVLFPVPARAQSLPDSCGNSAVLAWPISAFGDLPPATLAAYGLDGSELASFPLDDRPTTVYPTPIPSRVIAYPANGNGQILDIATGESFMLDPTLGKPAEFPLTTGSDSTLVAMMNDQELSFLDASTADVFPFTSRIEGDYSVFANMSSSPLVVLSGHGWATFRASGAIYLGEIRSDAPLAKLTEPHRGTWSEFSPSGELLAFQTSDFGTDLSTIEIVDLGMQSLVSIPIADWAPFYGPFDFVSDTTLAYLSGGGLHLFEIATQQDDVIDIGQEGDAMLTVSTDGSRLLVSGPLGLSLVDVPSRQSALVTGAETLTAYQLRTFAPRLDRVLFDESPTYTVVDLLAASMAEAAMVTTGQTPLSYMGATANLSHVVGITGTNSVTGAASLDLATGEVEEMASTDIEAPVVLFSPDRCYAAIGTFQAANDRRDASIEVADLDGKPVLHLDDAVLIGWATGA